MRAKTGNLKTRSFVVILLLLLSHLPILAQSCSSDVFNRLNNLASEIFINSKSCKTVVDPHLAREYLSTRSSILRAGCRNQIACAMFIEDAWAVVLRRCAGKIVRNTRNGTRNGVRAQNCYTCYLRHVMDFGGNTCMTNITAGWGVIVPVGIPDR